jgi:hypothetical protein
LSVNLSTGVGRQIFRRFSGDTGPDLDVTLEGGGPITNMDKPNSAILIWRDRFPVVSIAGTAITTISATLGTVTLDISTWLSTAVVPGDWKVAVYAKFTTGTPVDEYTYPWDVIRVERAG